MPFAEVEAKREYQRTWIAQRRTNWFEGKTCVECGSTKNLELDHVDKTQKVSHRIWSWSQKRRQAELAKCQVLCHPCHVAKSVECGDKAWGEAHGHARITLDDALEIIGSSEPTKVLAAQFNLSVSQINNIRSGRRWAHAVA